MIQLYTPKTQTLDPHITELREKINYLSRFCIRHTITCIHLKFSSVPNLNTLDNP